MYDQIKSLSHAKAENEGLDGCSGLGTEIAVRGTVVQKKFGFNSRIIESLVHLDGLG